MKQQTFLTAAVVLLALTTLACQANSSEKQQASASAELPAERNDSLIGFKGCERAGFKAISAQTREIKYQHYTFHLTSKEDGSETIEFKIDTIGFKFAKVADLEPTYFRGCAREHFFVDIGTAPHVREVIIYSLKKGVLSQVYRTPYIVGNPPYISENGNFWFFCPVEESEVSKIPDCPDKDAWQKDGLQVGYAQRQIYHMLNRGLTRKSEFICAPLQTASD